MIKTNATTLAREIGILEWEVSDGWLQRFKNQHGLVLSLPQVELFRVTCLDRIILKDYISKLDELQRFIDQSFDLRQLLITDIAQ